MTHHIKNTVRSLLLSAVLLPAGTMGLLAEDAAPSGPDQGDVTESVSSAEQSAPSSTTESTPAITDAPSVASSGGNFANTRQEGFGNMSSINQRGRSNAAVGLQSGIGNQAKVSQRGANNIATTVQVGNGFSRVIEQIGNKLSSSSFQVQNRTGVTASGSRTQKGVSVGYETK